MGSATLVMVAPVGVRDCFSARPGLFLLCSGTIEGRIEIMPRVTAVAIHTAGTIDGEDLRSRLVEASLCYHRAQESLTRAYAETDRLAGTAGEPWAQAWCRIVALREQAFLHHAHNCSREAGSHWETIGAEVLGDGEHADPEHLFTSDEVAALIAFVSGVSVPLR